MAEKKLVPLLLLSSSSSSSSSSSLLLLLLFKMPRTDSDEIPSSYELHIVDSAAFTSHSQSKKLLECTVCTFYKLL